MSETETTWQEREAKRDAQEQADREDFARRNEEARAHSAAVLAQQTRWTDAVLADMERRAPLVEREVEALERIAGALEREEGLR